MPTPLVQTTQVTTYNSLEITRGTDLVAVEEPLEMILEYGPDKERKDRTFGITMRSPGNDFELGIGLLFAEGVISSVNDIREIRHCRDRQTGEISPNLLRISLQPEIEIDWSKYERNMLMNASCGLCGKTTIEAFYPTQCVHNPETTPIINPGIIPDLNRQLTEQQAGFRYTGGLHATGLFDLNGKLILMREDIGRHNAMDKVVGAGLFTHDFLLHKCLIYWSGRASFELVQKAIQAGIPAVASVGPPSSMAVQLAAKFDMLLIGFVREERFQVYAGAKRLIRPILIQNGKNNS